MSWTIIIPGKITPSYNDYRLMHWRRQRELKKIWGLQLLVYSKDIPQAKGKRKVTITRISMGELDDPNLYTPIDKLLLDQMTKYNVKRVAGRNVKIPGRGWIIDDCPKWLELVCRQERGSKAMRIEIEDIDDE